MLKPLKTFCLGVAVFLFGCAAPGPDLPPPFHANGQALWKIISEQCVPNQLQRHDPKPCALVSLEGGIGRGFAVLKDRDGVAQYLLMPTAKITGIEAPQLLSAGAVNYFAEGWAARRFVEDRLGGPIPRADMSVAVNSIYGRSQDQLHLHVDCLAPGVRDALRADAPQIGPQWSVRRFTLSGHPYRIRRIDGLELGRVDPFRLLADTIPGAAGHMGAWTLVLAGNNVHGRPGFYLMAARADPAVGERASGEELQDQACHGLTHPGV